MGSTIHIADLDGNPVPLPGRKWIANVLVYVEDGEGNPVANAVVIGSWSGGVIGYGSCMTNTNGWCTITENLRNPVAIYTVTSVIQQDYTYNPIANHDPDGESDGTTITLIIPQ